MERYLLGLSKELDESAFHETFPYAHFRIFGMRIRNENEIQPNVSELLYQKIKKDQVSPRQMFKIVIYAAMNHIYSSRDIETACKRDINFMYLLEGNYL